MGLVLAAPTVAQDAPTGEVYFHEAAQHYLDEQTESALQTVNAGLRVAPDHPKLQALREKLKEQNEQQRSGGGSGTGSAPDQQQSGSQAPNGDNPDDANRQTPDGTADTDPRSEQGERERDASEAASDANQDGAPQNAEPSEAPQRPTDTLTRTQAERILQALANQEEQLLRQLQKHGSSEQRVEKDW